MPRRYPRVRGPERSAGSTRLGVLRARSAASTRSLALDETNGGSKELGGKPLLDQLIAAHKAYGESLGITIPEQDPAIIKVRETLLTFNRYLRAYVVAVCAHTDPDDPTSGALADALLAPLHKWVTYVTVAEEAEEEGDESLPGVGAGATPGQSAGQSPGTPGQTAGVPGVSTGPA